MQKMMPIMSVFFGLILYPMPSGLNLYIMASSLFGTIEQWVIRKHIKEQKEKKETEPSKAKTERVKPRKPSWFMGKLHELQKQAEEAQRTTSRRRKRP